MNADVMQTKVRCRMIREDDLEPLADLLVVGFPKRQRSYWTDGFARWKQWQAPPDLPRFGYMIEAEGRPVGVVLLLFHAADGTHEPSLRCNISSWYVDPRFRMHASMLVFFALKHRATTYINISPAPHTWATVEAQGFTRYTAGQVIALPALRRGGWGTTIHRFAPTRFAALPERQLLADHAAMGCDALVVEADGQFHPFVLIPFRMRSGRLPLPARQLVYCRSIEDYFRFAAPIGRYYLGRLVPFVIHDGDSVDPGFVGYYRPGMGPKYFRGPDRPRRGDIAYTERPLFGP